MQLGIDKIRYVLKSHLYVCAIYAVIALALLSSYPYVFPQFVPFPPLIILTVIVFVLFLCVSMYFKGSLKLLPKWFNNIVILQVIVWFLYIFIHRDFTYFTRISYIVNAYLALLCLYNCKGGIIKFTSVYNKWILLMAVMGLITFFLVLIINIEPIFEFENQDGRTAYFYGLSSTNAKIGYIIRYAGYFDEPGAMAFWGIWALILNRLFVKNELLEKSLMICLIFTFSMAYYIQLFFYLIFYKLKSFKHIVLVIFTCLVLGGLIYSSKDSDFDLYKLTFYRFEMDGDEVNGDNRSSLMVIAKAQFFKSPLVGIGAQNALENFDYMGDNPFTTLAYDGIIGTLTVYLPLLFVLFLAKKNKNILFAIFILALGYAQRPFQVNIISPFIMYIFTLLSFFKIRKINESQGKILYSDRLL